MKRLLTAVELGLVLFLSFNTLWNLFYLEKSFESVYFSVWALLIIFIFSFCRGWKGFRETGFRLDNLLPSLAKGVIFPCVIGAACWLWALRSGNTIEAPEWHRWLTFPLAGILQQFFFLGFFFNHYETVFRKSGIAGVLAALTFALYHVPNVPLMAVTFLGGLYLSLFYGRTRNLIAAGILHGWLSLVLTVTLEPAGIIKTYSVGPPPLKAVRSAVEASLTPETRIGSYSSSAIPGSFSLGFDRPVKLLSRFDDYKEMLEMKEPVLIAVSEDVHEGFAPHLKAPAYVRGRYNVWKRKFDDQGILTLKNAFNIPGLKKLYRRPVLIVSNRPADQ